MQLFIVPLSESWGQIFSVVVQDTLGRNWELSDAPIVCTESYCEVRYTNMNCDCSVRHHAVRQHAREATKASQ